MDIFGYLDILDIFLDIILDISVFEIAIFLPPGHILFYYFNLSIYFEYLSFLTPKISDSETKVFRVFYRLDLTQNFKTVLFPT